MVRHTQLAPQNLIPNLISPAVYANETVAYTQLLRASVYPMT